MINGHTSNYCDTVCIAFIGGKYCGPHATGYMKIWPSSTKSLPTPAVNTSVGSGSFNSFKFIPYALSELNG